MKFRFWSKFVLVLAVVLAIGGCQTQKSRKPSPDWSRGVPLGFSVQGSVGMAVGEVGPLFVWPEVDEGGMGVRYMALDETAVPLTNHLINFDQTFDELRAPRLALADGGATHLLWSSRPTGERLWTLYTVLLDSAGNPDGPIIQLSPPGTAVGAYVVAPDREGGVFVVWEDANTVSLHGQRLTATGAALPEPVLIAANAESPALQIDSLGTLHLLWFEGEQIMYAGMPGGVLETVVGAPIADIQKGPADSLVGPALGLTDDSAYAVWSILRRTGLEAGSAHTEYVAFAPNAPQISNSERLRLLTDEDLPYAPYQGGYQLTQLAAPSGIRGASDYVYRPDTAVGRGSDLAVAVETNQQSRLQTYTQIAVLVFAEGELQGHEMATKTESFSRDAILDVDASGQLHLIWREGAQGETVFYATTAPDAKNALDNLSQEDVFGALLTGGMESVTGILFFPVAFLWLLPGLGLMGLWKLHISDDEFSHPVTILLFIISVAVYETIKVLFLPTMTVYVPFSAWVDVGPAWRRPLLIGVPIAIFALAALAATVVYKRAESKSGLLAYFALAATDAILSLAVYGVNFLGVF